MHHILSRTKQYVYCGSCVSLPEQPISDMQDAAIDITCRTFRQHIGTENWETLSDNFGYTKGEELSLATDQCVSFHRSKFKGQRCYYCSHSSIFYVFVLQED